MKTLILYATKHGAAREIAVRTAGMIPGAITADIGREAVPALGGFDCIIIGAPVYASSVPKKMKEFAADNLSILTQKKLGIFVCGISDKGSEDYFSRNYPQELLSHASAKSFIGGIYDPSKAGFFERLIMRIVTKSNDYLNLIQDKAIAEFVSKISNPPVKQ